MENGKWEMKSILVFLSFACFSFSFSSFDYSFPLTVILPDYVGFPSLTLPLKAEINYKGKPMQTADSADIGKINC